MHGMQKGWAAVRMSRGESAGDAEQMDKRLDWGTRAAGSNMRENAASTASVQASAASSAEQESGMLGNSSGGAQSGEAEPDAHAGARQPL